MLDKRHKPNPQLLWQAVELAYSLVSQLLTNENKNKRKMDTNLIRFTIASVLVTCGYFAVVEPNCRLAYVQLSTAIVGLYGIAATAQATIISNNRRINNRLAYCQFLLNTSRRRLKR